MASALYDSYKQDNLLRDLGVDFDTDTIRIIMLTSSYTFSAAHNAFDDLTNTVGDGGSTRADGEILAGKSGTGGVADATDPVFASATGTNITGFALYKDSGVDSTSYLLGFFDLASFSVTAQQVTIAFDAAGIFAY